MKLLSIFDKQVTGSRAERLFDGLRLEPVLKSS